VTAIVVILLTWQRTAYALRTIVAAKRYLTYDGPLLWYVADDGSDAAHVAAVLGHVGDGWHSERRGYGGNANAAWDQASAVSPLSLWLEDDWELRRPLDLTPYAALLARDDVGMVRLGYIDPAMLGPAQNGCHPLPRAWADTSFYAFTGHPSLRHVRYRQAYGDYPVGLGPGDTELAYAYQYRVGPEDGPRIVWPAGYPTGGLFGHIGEIKTESML